MRCSGDRHNFAPGSSRCHCGTHTALGTGDLPYPSWVLDEASRGETPGSRYAHATDPRSGRTFLVRMYMPDAGSASPAGRRRFIAIAKSLRNSPVKSERILFAYTRNGCCYTVVDPVGGTRLFAPGPVSVPGPAGRAPGSADLSRLEDLLSALRELHAAGTAAGPLFHGNLRPGDVFADGSGHGGLHLLHSLYLENVLSDNPLPPEHFQAADLLAAADLILPLAPGPHTTADRAFRLGRLTDPLLGATLEYMYGMHGTRPDSAGAALSYLHLLRRAAGGPDRGLFGQASSISPSPRLRPFLLAPPSAPQPPNPHLGSPNLGSPNLGSPNLGNPNPPNPPAAPPPPPPPFRPVAPVQAPPAPASARYTPVTSPPVTGNSRASRPKPPAGRRRRGGGCLLPLIVALLLLVWVVAMLRKGPAAATSLDFSAEPNPAPRRAPVQLRWSSSGFDRLELDGKQVQANGSRLVIANASHRYRLAGLRPDGSRQIRDLEVSVLPHHAPKPSPGVPFTSQPTAAKGTAKASKGDAGTNSANGELQLYPSTQF